MFIFDTATEQWKSFGNMMAARAFHAVSVVNVNDYINSCWMKEMNKTVSFIWSQFDRYPLNSKHLKEIVIKGSQWSLYKEILDIYIYTIMDIYRLQ